MPPDEPEVEPISIPEEDPDHLLSISDYSLRAQEQTERIIEQQMVNDTRTPWTLFFNERPVLTFRGVPTPVVQPQVRHRSKTLFCVVGNGGFSIKAYHSLKSARKHEPKDAYINYATKGDMERATFYNIPIPPGVMYSKLGHTAGEPVSRRTSRSPRARARTSIRTVSPATVQAPRVHFDVAERVEAMSNTRTISRPQSTPPSPNCVYVGTEGGCDFWSDTSGGRFFLHQIPRRP